jgi:hypothetical protein
MVIIHEYEVWSKPGNVLHTDYGKTIQEEICETDVFKDVFKGISNVPDNIDCKNLKYLIDKGELSNINFIEFCNKRCLPPRIDNPVSACNFLEFKNGCCVAWIHLPNNFPRNNFLIIKNFVENKNLLIKDNQ